MTLASNLSVFLADYKALLTEVDGWFAASQDSFPDQIVCRKGCSGCCRGLFDISLMDAALIQTGIAALSPVMQQQVLARCSASIPELQKRWPSFSSPWLLNRLPDEQWQQMPEDDPTPCPLLAEDGTCRVYEYRPMICRLHGLPNIDDSGEDFTSEICSLNFRTGLPKNHGGLQWKFRSVFSREIVLFEGFCQDLTGQPLRELDTFIPCAPLIDFRQTDWKDIGTAYSGR